MRLLRTLVTKLCRHVRFLHKRRYRKGHGCTAILMGAVVLTIMLLFVSGFSGVGKNKVYAEQQKKTESEDRAEQGKTNELQAGLMGIMNGIASMEEYSQFAKSQNVTMGAGEEVLVGASRANSVEINRMTLERGIEQVRSTGIGYSASQIVRNNHMPTEDYETLLQIVEAEATGCDMKSKILVANVVLNRVNNSHFPDNIYDVVWQRVSGDPQFSPTADGRINSVIISKETIEAVDRALNGEDYSQGALYFIAHQGADPVNTNWFESKLQKLFDYGGHEFYTYAGY